MPDEITSTISFWDEDEPVGDLEVVQVGEFDPDEDTPVYGIAFPASMLPIGVSSGKWESEPLLELNDEKDETLVRVWLYPDE